MSLSKITPCLWFNGQAEEAANLYTSIFKASKITKTQRYTEAGKETHGQEPGSVLVVAFELNGQPFVALNGGPQFKFNEAISFQIDCADQEEVDYYWEQLGKDADDTKQQCGWLGDKFGVVWQVVPTVLKDMLGDSDVEKVKRVTVAMMAMKKLDIVELQKAYDG